MTRLYLYITNSACPGASVTMFDSFSKTLHFTLESGYLTVTLYDVTPGEHPGLPNSSGYSKTILPEHRCSLPGSLFMTFSSVRCLCSVVVGGCRYTRGTASATSCVSCVRGCRRTDCNDTSISECR